MSIAGVASLSVTDIYPSSSLEQARTRVECVNTAFRNAFADVPMAIVRAPGRVNLIGEHIDYEGYDVLPMAIDRDVIIAVGPSDGTTVNAINTSAQYAPAEFSTDPRGRPDLSKHSWASYLHGAFGALHAAYDCKLPQRGANLCVDGTVPAGSGLSSSSAICCAALCAFSRLWAPDTDPAKIARIGVDAEHRVGTQSGGMDQAISMLATRGVAKLVQFQPTLRALDVCLPSSAVFIIGNSLTVSNKAETASSNYNFRVLECRLASRLLAKHKGLANFMEYDTLRDVESQCGATDGSTELPVLLGLVESALQQGAYSVADVEAVLGEGAVQLVVGDDQVAQAVVATVGDKRCLELRKRARHVFSESKRVHAFRSLCMGEMTRSSEDAVLQQLAQLMDESHASCRDDYECSSSALDVLVAEAKAAGALGARLTGAGWGGCAVALCNGEAAASRVVDALRSGFYAGKVQPSEFDSVCFVTRPASGAAVLQQ